MQASLIIAHPNPDSFNHAIMKTIHMELLKQEIDIHYHDLYQEDFDPILRKEEINNDNIPAEMKIYCNEIQASDLIIIVHPNWSGQPPAILKGWIDRVMRAGISFQFEETEQGPQIKGLLKAQTTLIITTSDTPEEIEKTVYGNTLHSIWNNNIFQVSGVKKITHKIFSPVLFSSSEQRKGWLEQTQELIQSILEAQ